MSLTFCASVRLLPAPALWRTGAALPAGWALSRELRAAKSAGAHHAHSSSAAAPLRHLCRSCGSACVPASSRSNASPRAAPRHCRVMRALALSSCHAAGGARSAARRVRPLWQHKQTPTWPGPIGGHLSRSSIAALPSARPPGCRRSAQAGRTAVTPREAAPRPCGDQRGTGRPPARPAPFSGRTRGLGWSIALMPGFGALASAHGPACLAAGVPAAGLPTQWQKGDACPRAQQEQSIALQTSQPRP